MLCLPYAGFLYGYVGWPSKVTSIAVGWPSEVVAGFVKRRLNCWAGPVKRWILWWAGLLSDGYSGRLTF